MRQKVVGEEGEEAAEAGEEAVAGEKKEEEAPVQNVYDLPHHRRRSRSVRTPGPAPMRASADCADATGTSANMISSQTATISGTAP